MLCSWLDVKKNIGSFFMEQAKILSQDNHIILGNIQEEKKTPLWKYYKYIKYSNIQKSILSTGISVYSMLLPKNELLPKKISKKINNYFYKKLYKTIESEHGKIDIIHAQSIFDAGLQAYFYHQTFGVPFIFTEHNQLSFIGIENEKVAIIKEILKKPYSKLVVSNDKIRQFATNHLFAEFEVIGNTVDGNVFNYTKKEKSEIITLTTIGHFYPIKDQETILKALQIVDDYLKDKRIIYNWIGFNGWGYDESQFVDNTLMKYHFKNIEVRKFPLLSKEEISKKLKETDLFLFSSLTEGMPVSIMEALACGVPVCTTNCGGVEELINQKNGCIIPIKDFQAMANFIQSFIQNNYFDNQWISKDLHSRWGAEKFRTRMNDIYLKNINT